MKLPCLLSFALCFLSQSLVASDLAKVETSCFRFSVGPTGEHELLDKKTGVVWKSATPPRLGVAGIVTGGQARQIDLVPAQLTSEHGAILATVHPVGDTPTATLRLRFRALNAQTLEVSYDAPEVKVENIKLLDSLLTVTDAAAGHVVVPVREGLLIPADSGLKFEHRFDTYAYEGCHMAMLGLVQGGAALLLTWDDPYVAAELKSVLGDSSDATYHQRLTASLSLRKSARSWQLHVLGKTDYVGIAGAYREVARRRGLLCTWADKLKGHPERAKLFGAANIKLWSTLDRRMNLESTQEESSRVNWTFDEAAQVAEHLKNDLKLDKVLFTIGGWIHRGYDNQHPDILPTAPECGGDAAFADCAHRVMNLGYLFCLHDNYQDIYRDSPSWNEKYIMRTADGQLTRGGHWAGGQAYLTCSKMALELAQRPQNLVAVKKLSGANSYFIDTTYAAGLQECFAPTHSLSRADDMHWKQALSDYGRQVFGVFGSECGREWAIPHSDFFEGLTGVSGTYYHDKSLPGKVGGTVVPLFELVYRDSIAMYGKYGYDPQRAAEYVLHHISIGRPLNYHSMPRHLYWKSPEDGKRSRTAAAETQARSPQPDPAVFTRGDNGWAADLVPMDRFIKNTCEILCPLNEITAQLQMTSHRFLTADRKVQRTIFGDGKNAVEVIVNGAATNYSCSLASGGKIVLPPYGFLVSSREFASFHALSWADHRYETPTLFTLRSLDARPLEHSRRLRVFHAFGPDEVEIGRKLVKVPTEAILTAPGA